jgi:DNA-binding response OmpR family regulator
VANTLALAPELTRERERVGRDRIDDGSRKVLARVVCADDLVPESRDRALEKLTRLVEGIGDENSRHRPIVGGGKEDHVCWRNEVRMSARVLVVEDEEDVRGLLRELLERAGYAVTEAPDGRAALRVLFDARPDLVLLDVNMPHLDGWETLDRIRDVTDIPVIMLTARAGELEKVRALKGGADDYVTKPFGRQELLARVEAVLRRRRTRGADTFEVYADDFLTIDYAQREVRVGGEHVPLTPTEFRLLTTLVSNPNQVLSRDQLLELVWNDTSGLSGDQVKLYVGYLRRKLGGEGGETPIETVRGFGYRYRRSARPA